MNPEDRFVLLDLSDQLDNVAITYFANTGDGAFNVWENSFPAEELPESNSLVRVGGVPFRFPSKEPGDKNSLVCRGQLLELPQGTYDWIYVLGAAERRTEDWVYLHYAGGAADPEWLRISDFWPGPSRFGELEAFRCQHMHYPRHVQPNVRAGMWQQRVPVPRREPLERLRLPENVAIHLFAVTLMRAVDLEHRAGTGREP